MSFVKLHAAILDSSVWDEPSPTRIVWITLLAMADERGIVEASIGGLAARARVSRAECEAALATFLGPDPDSRDGTTGERIERVPGGWLVLNHAEYRDKQTRAQAQAAARVARHRAKKRARDSADPLPLPGVTGNAVTPRYDFPPSEAEADPEADSEGGGDLNADPRAPARAQEAPPDGSSTLPEQDPEPELVAALAATWQRIARVEQLDSGARQELRKLADRLAGEPEPRALFERAAAAFTADCEQRRKRVVLSWFCAQFHEWSAAPAATSPIPQEQRAAQLKAELLEHVKRRSQPSSELVRQAVEAGLPIEWLDALREHIDKRIAEHRASSSEAAQ